MTPPQKLDYLAERLDTACTKIEELERRTQTLQGDMDVVQKIVENPQMIDVSKQLYFPPSLTAKLLAYGVMLAFLFGAGQWFASYTTTSGSKETLNAIASDLRNLATRFDIEVKEIRYKQANEVDRNNAQEKDLQDIKRGVKR